jgi:hypothetical protein
MTNEEIQDKLKSMIEEAEDQCAYWQRESSWLRDPLYGLQNPDAPEAGIAKQVIKDIEALNE